MANELRVDIFSRDGTNGVLSLQVRYFFDPSAVDDWAAIIRDETANGYVAFAVMTTRGEGEPTVSKDKRILGNA